MTLKTLEKANAEGWQRHQEAVKLGEPHPNGIACPKCGEELWDSNPMMIPTSYPAQKNVHCPKCEYRGYRIV